MLLVTADWCFVTLESKRRETSLSTRHGLKQSGPVFRRLQV